MPRIDTDVVVVAILTTNNIENGELDRIWHLQTLKFISIHDTVVVILPRTFLDLSTCDDILRYEMIKKTAHVVNLDCVPRGT